MSADDHRESLSTRRELFELLAAVVDLPEEEREAVLEGHDEGIAAEVRALISGDDPDDGFLAGPGASTAEGSSAAGLAETALPKSIGPYQPLELLGEGGMGRVFLAAQEEPVRRQVALKVLRFAVAGPEAEARFAAERHAMARLDHPNVGKLLEAGTTDEGQPYFAMELIAGAPITTYCDEHSLDLADRLRLFVDVCRGVDHAHGKLLLHRDLKPSNVLVTEVDGRAMPKIIDFGIAKGLDPSLGNATMGTGDRFIGTPTYMSPEALGLGGELGVRSDVFSLGVLLHELLTGAPPWPASVAGPALAIQHRLETAVRRPSTYVATLAPEEQERIARHRGSAAPALSRSLRGDLDWIVLRAIAEEPARRYASAAELADDVSRLLRHEPISARSPSAAYLMRKLVRRHRLAAAAAAVALLGVTAGIVGTSIGLVRARAAEERARNQAKAAVQARDETREVLDFLTGVFRDTGLDSRESKPPAERTARELLDAGAARIDTELAGQPLARARVSATIGQAYRELGLLDLARKRLETALELQRASPEVRPRETANTMQALGMVDVQLANLDEATTYFEGALAIAPRTDDPDDVQFVAGLLGNLGRVARRRGDYAEAEKRSQQAIALLREQPEIERGGLPAEINNLGNIYFVAARWTDAEAQYREALALFEALPQPGSERVAQVLTNLGGAVASQGRLEEAAPLFERALAEIRRMLGDEHPRLATALHNLGMLRLQLDQPELAEPYHREALAIRERVLGPNHPSTAWSLDGLARTEAALGRFDEARRLQERALAIREQPGLDPGDIAPSLEHLAELADHDGDLNKARELYARARVIRQEHVGPNHRMTANTTLNLGLVEWRLGERESARERLGTAVSILRAGGSEMADDLAEAQRRIEAAGASVPDQGP